jgi:hypothetical protein
MNISPLSKNSYNSPNFGHSNPWADSPYNLKDRLTVAGTTALGVGASLAILSKRAGHSLKPSKMFHNIKEAFAQKKPSLAFKNFKNTYIYKAPYDEKEVITIGAGSCIGGLAGGCIIDKEKENRKAKLRETLLQVTNISVPILIVGRFAAGGKYLGKKFFEKNSAKETYRTLVPQALSALAGLFLGVFSGNYIGNKINEHVYHKGKGRSVQASDFSAHLDDFVLAATYVSKSDIVHALGRLVPFALMIPGYEIGTKEATK